MIDFTKLTLGDKIYSVKESNTVLSRKRITMVDSDGIEWYRYDRENWEYTVDVIEYCGKTTIIKEGETALDELTSGSYHFKHPDGVVYGEDAGEESWLRHWFTSVEEAEEYIAEEKVLRKQMK